ncbi:MAG: ParB N-terminal domain-containing protein [Gammaproteobacteria bacterium]|nr:ParB N-terminal domain-containing protein [Gammaproteobacteria bacterium]
MKTPSLQHISTQKIEFDYENPRIKVALEKYGDQLNESRIRFALQTAAEGSSRSSSYRSLKDSIRASGGISVPIVVKPNDGSFVCIDGNTRLAVYRELHDEGVRGDWETIDCLVLQDPEKQDIETIRVTAHLVGAREWPAYEKARYLHYLRNVEFISYEELISRCGGNKTEIDRQIDAFHDMNEYYRDICTDDAFKLDRFSGFVELQKRGIKEAIFNADFDLHDFGRWIRDGQIYRLENVRRLPVVLADEEARNTFVTGGIRSIEDAIKIIDDRQIVTDKKAASTPIGKASMSLLAEALLQKITDLPRKDYIALRDQQSETALRDIETLTDLNDQLADLLNDVRE